MPEQQEETAPAGQSTATTQTAPPPNSRSTADYDDSDKTGPNFTDHFSLRHPSSTVRFRGARVHVYEAGNEQILLEDHRSSRDVGNDDDNGRSRQHHRHTITVKRMDWSGFGLRTLRLAYALIALLLVGFAFVLCFQIVLFLFLNLPIDANASSIEARRGRVRIVGTLLSVPVFLFGMASLMAIGTTFVADCWRGGPLIRAVSGLPSLVTEVLFFVFFILVPALTAVVTLMAQYENPWEVTCRAWCLSVAFVFCTFGIGVVYREVQACFQLVSLYFDNNTSVEDQATIPTWKKWMLKIRRATLLTTMQRYSGHKNEQYLVTGEDVAPEGGFTFSDKHKPRQSKRGLHTRFTQMKCLSCIYDAMDPPKRLYTIEEVRDVLPFVTRHNWSLESMFCRKNRERGIVSAKGPSALTLDQVKASVICNIGATTLVSLIIIAFLVWFNAGTIFYVFGAIVCVLCCIWPLARTSAETMEMYKDINSDENFDEVFLEDEEAFVDEADGKDDAEAGDENEKPAAHEEHHQEKRTIFQLWETTRVSQPKELTCYSLIAFEFFFFFVWPMCVLFITRNYPVAVVFLLVSIVAMFRKFFDPSAVLCELGSMNDIDIETNPGEGELYKITGRTKSLKGPDKTLVLKARLADIVGNISRSAATTRWMWFFGTLVLLIFLLFLQAINSDDGLGERPPIVLVNDFYYPGEQTLQYPTCQLSKGFKIGDSDTALGDYSMLSALAYETTNVTDYLLPQYFGGESVAIDEDEFVANYRDDSGTASVPVYFKFITFPSVPDLGVVAIRGSQTSWDWVVNMQLWSAAGLAQAVKWGIPYGWLWHPILDELVSFVDFIQNENIKRVSYYTVTSGFINDVLDGYGGSNFTTLRVTGASLGGGLAIISGAQTGAPAVAISGLGAELSRHTLDPPVTMAQINENVFNFIPDRDYIARIGGRPRQHQEAQCQASTSSLFGCHSMWRSVCEIAYRCGSNGRPVPCRCVQRFGYPEPLPVGNTNRTFLQACEEQEEAFLNATGSTVTSGYFD